MLEPEPKKPRKPSRPTPPTPAELEKAFVEQGLAMLGPAARRQARKVRLAPGDPLATVVLGVFA